MEGKYLLLLSQMQSLMEGKHHALSKLANAAALLWSELDDINWVGFYLLSHGELILGPFQGKVACMEIAVGKGVCGRAAAENAVQAVDDVHSFQGHIACDSASNSELVIPLRNQGTLIGVLDIDSPSFGRFKVEDVEGLEAIAGVIEKACDWNFDIGV